MHEKMSEECAEKLQLSLEEAEERVERYFAELQYFLSVEYEENMELIDKRINNYYNLANTRIMLMASNGIRLETAINDFLIVVSKMPGKEQDIAMDKVADCTRITNQRYVGYKSFEKQRRTKNAGENIGLSAVELSDEEKSRQTEALFHSAPNRYSVERVGDFLDVQMGSDKAISIKEKSVKSREEALMYAAAMLYAKNAEFPFEVQVSDEVVRTDIADISNVKVSKR